MTIASENVRPAIVIKVQKACTPAEKACISAQTGLKCDVFEVPAAEIAIQARGIPGKIRLYNVQLAVPVDVGSGNPHARLRLSVGAKRHTCFQPDIGERPVMVVFEEC